MLAAVVIIIAYSIVVTGKTEKVMVKAIPVALKAFKLREMSLSGVT